MRAALCMRLVLLLASTGVVTAIAEVQDNGSIIADTRTASSKLFDELEELSRLVGISYCVGFQGITKPFECSSYCSDFDGFELVETWNSGLIDSASCGYMALSHESDPPRVILAFRGSNSLSDAISDLMTLPAEYVPYEPPKKNDTVTSATPREAGEQPECQGCKAHAGFLYAWHTTRDTILEKLRDTVRKHPGYELVLVGHSLGGAIAGLAALEFAAMGWSPSVTTFGEPRFGNEELAIYTDKMFPIEHNSSRRDSVQSNELRDDIGRYRRVTHVDDPVPLYPLEQWGWRMHSGEVYISKAALPPTKEDVIVCNGPQDPACISGGSMASSIALQERGTGLPGFPAEWKLWEILFAHRRYFWRLGLCWDPQSGGYPKTLKEAGNNDAHEL